MIARDNRTSESRIVEENADIGLDWVLAVVEGVDCALTVVAAKLFTRVLIRNTSYKIDKVGVVHLPRILEAARAFLLARPSRAILARSSLCAGAEDEAAVVVGRAVRTKVGEGLAELVGAEGSTLLDSGNSHESVDEVVRSDFTLLSIEETVDVCSA